VGDAWAAFVHGADPSTAAHPWPAWRASRAALVGLRSDATPPADERARVPAVFAAFE
jgi:carboxylesterase type B